MRSTTYGKQPAMGRFLAKVDESADCWMWLGGTCRGYGAFWFDGQMRPAHRVAYELFVGPIAEGHQIDHLCRARLCVNPLHLEAVTQAENLRRQGAAQTTCKRGHLLWERTGEGFRFCRICKQERERKRRAARRTAA